MKGQLNMKLNYSKLLGRIVEKYGSQRAFAAELDVSENTVSRKMNSETGFSQEDILLWCKLLEIPEDRIPSYFFVKAV